MCGLRQAKEGAGEARKAAERGADSASRKADESADAAKEGIDSAAGQAKHGAGKAREGAEQVRVLVLAACLARSVLRGVTSMLAFGMGYLCGVSRTCAWAPSIRPGSHRLTCTMPTSLATSLV